MLVVSAGGTLGWRVGARGLVAALELAGARVVHAEAGAVREVRTLMGTDLVQASAARKAALLAGAEHRPEAIIYCSVTAALLWDRPGAIWLDATAAENRPGRHGLWQRPLEVWRLRRAPVLLEWGPRALDVWDARHGADGRAEAIVVPPPVQPSGPGAAGAVGPSGAGEPARDVAAVAYAADPVKRRLDVVLDAWAAARRDGEELVVVGLERPARPGVRFAGRLPAEEYRALLRRARVFLAAPRREDYGIAALEALADGAMLVTTPAEGPYEALELARRLDPRLVADDASLPLALRAALDEPRPQYAAQAASLVAPYTVAAVSATLNEQVLPRLLPGWRG